MPTSVLTHRINPPSPTLSTIASTLPGLMQLLYNYFTSLAGSADCHWEVCSSSLAASPYYVTLKRKSGAAGRILFMGVATAPGSSYNPQLFNYAWSGSGIRAAWFPEATSDVPANLLAASGDVFTAPNNSTSLCANVATYTGTAILRLWSSEEGIYLLYGIPANGPIGIWGLGDLAVDVLDNAIPLAGVTVGFADSITASPNYTSFGWITRFSGVPCFVANVMTYPFALGTALRDNSVKKTGYLPILLGTVASTMERIFFGKLRQVANGPIPLATHEIINMVDGGVATQKALGLNPMPTTHLAWLTNFKF